MTSGRVGGASRLSRSLNATVPPRLVKGIGGLLAAHLPCLPRWSYSWIVCGNDQGAPDPERALLVLGPT